MNKYLLFVGDWYYPAGFEDYRGMFDCLDSAKNEAEKLLRESSQYTNQWFEIICISENEATLALKGQKSS